MWISKFVLTQLDKYFLSICNTFNKIQTSFEAFFFLNFGYFVVNLIILGFNTKLRYRITVKQDSILNHSINMNEFALLCYTH